MELVLSVHSKDFTRDGKEFTKVTEELAIHPSELHAPRREEDVQAKVTLHKHACDAMRVVRHAAVTVVWTER